MNSLLLKEIKNISRTNEIPIGSSGEILNEISNNKYRNQIFKVKIRDENPKEIDNNTIKFSEERNLFDEFEKNQGRVTVENLEKTLSGSLFSDYVLNLRFFLRIHNISIKEWDNIYLRLKSTES